MAEPVRIHKALADAGVASRRAAEALVEQGRVTVNGAPATVGQRVDPDRDALAVDGRVVAGRPQATYLLLAKPAGVTSTVADRHARHTVLELVPADLRREARRLYPVGRLDVDSEGLLLLTNDGDWAQRMLHPSHLVEREYAVGLTMPLDDRQWRGLELGIPLDEGEATIDHLRPATSAEVRLLGELIGPDAGRLVWYRAVLHQGWKRQLRRMFGAVGARVERLVRVRFGTLRLTGMKLGEVRELSVRERRQLETLVATEAKGAPISESRRPLVVSIDGPGSSGKSTVGALAAGKLGYRFCDTGVLYRGLTLLAVRRGVDPDDSAAILDLVPHLRLVPDRDGRYVRLISDGLDLTDELHTETVDATVSRVSRHAEVRQALLPFQRGLAESGGIVMAGRDIGSVVLRDADVKIYLNVSVEERARRRATQRSEADDPQALRRIEDELRRRDGIDSSREAAPLRIPDGAVVIDSDTNTLEETVDEVVRVIRQSAA